jgi:hypothetical protein
LGEKAVVAVLSVLLLVKMETQVVTSAVVHLLKVSGAS